MFYRKFLCSIKAYILIVLKLKKKINFCFAGIEAIAPLVQWFWEVMDEFSNQERSLFLRFVWGRTRLPRTIADFRGRDFVLQVRNCHLSIFQ